MLSGNPFDSGSTPPFIPLTQQKPVQSDPPVVVPKGIEASVADAKKKSVNEEAQLNLEAMGIQTEGDLDDIIRQIDKRIAELEAEESAPETDGGDKE